MEERHLDSVLLQVSGRIEQVDVSADSIQADFNDPDAPERVLTEFSFDHSFTPMSVSTGAVWDFTPVITRPFPLPTRNAHLLHLSCFHFGPHMGRRFI